MNLKSTLLSLLVSVVVTIVVTIAVVSIDRGHIHVSAPHEQISISFEQDGVLVNFENVTRYTLFNDRITFSNKNGNVTVHFDEVGTVYLYIDYFGINDLRYQFNGK